VFIAARSIGADRTAAHIRGACLLCLITCYPLATRPRAMTQAPLSFDVVYRDAAGTDVLLGNVGLYPADRPGHFIVATQAKLRAGGQVQVTLRAEGVRDGVTIRVTLGRIRFADG
jgi:hypothetical protein